jgi:hypothetical protein
VAVHPMPPPYKREPWEPRCPTRTLAQPPSRAVAAVDLAEFPSSPSSPSPPRPR